MNFASIIVAGGSGKRFGSKQPKQFLLLNKKPMFIWSILAFKQIKQCKQIILVVPKDKLLSMQKYKKLYNIDIIAGGKERYNSVQNAINCVNDNIDIISVHDAARPLVTKQIIQNVFNKACKYDGAIASSLAKDTIKYSTTSTIIEKSINRNYIWQAQTPQMFKATILKNVYSKKIPTSVTDDAQLVEKLGKKVFLVDSGYENFKVTHKIDFKLAEFILKQR